MPAFGVGRVLVVTQVVQQGEQGINLAVNITDDVDEPAEVRTGRFSAARGKHLPSKNGPGRRAT